MSRALEDITAMEIIEALDGPVALTDCVEGAEDACNVESLCPMRGGWDKVNTAIRRALQEVTLAELCPSRDYIADAPPARTTAGSRRCRPNRGDRDPRSDQRTEGLSSPW